MFTVVQVPITDLRRLVKSPDRLPLPNWPLAEADREFVRSFGVVELRRRGGSGSWVGEDRYSTARRGLRFVRAVPPKPEMIAFRRLLSDGDATTRIEVGFRERKRSDETGAKSRDVLEAVSSCLSTSVEIKTESGPRRSALARCGADLASLYRRSTTRVSHTSSSTQGWCVKAGRPTAIVEYNYEREQFSTNGTRALALEEPGIRLTHVWVREEGRMTVGVWLLGHAGENYSFDYLRRLRLHLLRMHAERESLKHTLRCISSEMLMIEGHGESEPLDRFLATASRNLSRKSRFGIPQRDLLTAYEADALINDDDRALALAMEKLRPAVQKRVKTVIAATNIGTQTINQFNQPVTLVQGRIETMTTTTITLGNNNVLVDSQIAGSIQGSYNRVAEADTTVELRDLLKQYIEEVSKMTEKVSPDDKEAVAKNLEVLTKEATAPKPDRDYVTLALNRIETIAGKVADVAPKVIAIGKKLLPLIALI